MSICPGQLWLWSPQNAVYTPVLFWKSQKNCSNIISHPKKLNFSLLNVLHFRLETNHYCKINLLRCSVAVTSTMLFCSQQQFNL